MRNQQIQTDLLSEDRTPIETLNYALARERGQANQQNVHNSQSSQSHIHTDNPWFEKIQSIKRKNRGPILPTPQTGQIQNCRRCGNKFLPGHLTYAPRKTKLAEYAKRSAISQNYADQKCHHAPHSDHNNVNNKRIQEYTHRKGKTNWHKDKHNKKLET